MACLEAPIPFTTLKDRDTYTKVVAEHYRNLKDHWLTPAELFRPHIGRSIASYIVKRLEEKQYDGAVTLVELGGGTGSLACDILEWLRKHRKDVYGSCTYTSIDISANLAHVQQKRAQESGHGDIFQSCVGDACLPETWQKFVGQRECFIIGMEVLDNLPHDKVVAMNGGDGDMVWMESCVDYSNDIEETFRPVSDDTLRRVLNVYLQIRESQPWSNTGGNKVVDSVFKWLLDVQGVPEPVFLPTSACMLFDAIHHTVPKHEIILADFDHLPDVIIAGENAPLVSSTQGGKTRDWGTLFPPFGSSDIFFPSNFELLKQMYLLRSTLKSVSQGVRYEKAASFFKNNVPDISQATTQSGFVPLLEDYSNTTFLLTTQADW